MKKITFLALLFFMSCTKDEINNSLQGNSSSGELVVTFKGQTYKFSGYDVNNGNMAYAGKPINTNGYSIMGQTMKPTKAAFVCFWQETVGYSVGMMIDGNPTPVYDHVNVKVTITINGDKASGTITSANYSAKFTNIKYL